MKKTIINIGWGLLFLLLLIVGIWASWYELEEKMKERQRVQELHQYFIGK